MTARVPPLMLAIALACAPALRADVIDTDLDPPDVRIHGQSYRFGGPRANIGAWAATGDFNGDGLADIATSSGMALPKVIIIFGRTSWPSVIDLATTAPDVVIREVPTGRADTSCLAEAVVTLDEERFTPLAGSDVTGDGIDDLVMGGECWPVAGAVNGIVLVVPGRAIWPPVLDLDPETWTPAIIGPAVNGRFAASVVVTDFDGDGSLDILAGVTRAPSRLTGASEVGRVYAIRGPIAESRQDVDSVASLIDGTGTTPRLGRPIGSGRLAPGRPEAIVLGLDLDDTGKGRVVLLDGSALEPMAPVDTTSALIGQLHGTVPWQRFGQAIDVGDVDCSGWGDLLVSSFWAERPDGRGLYAGRVDLYSDVGLGLAAGTSVPTLSIWGRQQWFYEFFWQIASVHLADLDGDGFEDIILGQPVSDGPDHVRSARGEVAIIWSRPDLPPVIDLEVDSEWHTTITGSRTGRGYGAAANVADLDGNETLDLIVGSARQREVGTFDDWPDGGIDIFLRNLHVTTVSPEAGPDQIADILAGATDCSTTVTLDATASIDRDGHPMRHRWYEGTTLLAEGEVVTVSLPPGDHCIRLLSTSDGGWAQDKVQVTVRDLAPPEIRSITVDPTDLWPPNHRMRPVHVTVDAWDACTPVSKLSVRLVGVTSNEPVDDRGDGHSDPDIAAWEVGTADFDGDLRAERSGRRRGREYTLTYEVVDAAGNSVVGSATVAVVHDRSGLRGTRATRRPWTRGRTTRASAPACPFGSGASEEPSHLLHRVLQPAKPLGRREREARDDLPAPVTFVAAVEAAVVRAGVVFSHGIRPRQNLRDGVPRGPQCPGNPVADPLRA